MPLPAQPTILVTGATDGLGRAVAERLIDDGASVLVHGRDADRLEATARELRERAGDEGRVQPFRADFARLADVRGLAVEVARQVDRLDVLINNAGIGSGLPDSPNRQESEDGYELRFAVNYLATFVLTLGLLPMLRDSAPARVVMVSSIGQAPIDFDDPQIEHGYSGARAYGQSKLAQITFANELARRVPPDELTANSLHPATYMPTKIVLETVGHSIDTLEEGVEATVRLATSPELDGVTGEFFDRERPARADAQAYDEQAAERLWQLSLALTGVPDSTI